MYDLQDLMATRTKGEAIESFLTTRDSVLIALKTEQTEEVLRVLFLKQLYKCPSLEEELAHYQRFLDSDPRKSCDYLLQMVRRTLARRRQDAGRQLHARAFAGDFGQGNLRRLDPMLQFLHQRQSPRCPSPPLPRMLRL